MKYSIIVPIYNVEKYLEKCLDSLVGQSFSNYEIILVDDGSTDRSSEIAAEYQKRYSDRIRSFRQENQGLGGARNTGIEEADGKYLMFVDSDDYIALDALEKLDVLVAAEDPDMLYFNAYVVDEKGNILGQAASYHSMEAEGEKNLREKEDLICFPPGAWLRIYKKELFTDNNLFYDKRVWYEDLRLTPKLAAASQKICYLNEALYYYVQREGSILRNKNLSRNIEIIDAIEELRNYFAEKGLYQKYSAQIEYLAVLHILMYGVNRINNIDSGNELQDVFVSYVESHFPCYADNIYLKQFHKKRELKKLKWISQRNFLKLFYVKKAEGMWRKVFR